MTIYIRLLFQSAVNLFHIKTSPATIPPATALRYSGKLALAAPVPLDCATVCVEDALLRDVVAEGVVEEPAIEELIVEAALDAEDARKGALKDALVDNEDGVEDRAGDEVGEALAVVVVDI